MGVNSDFDKCVTRRYVGDRFVMECKLGLWGVDAPTKGEAESEATHYWLQYKSDGEYSSIIGGKGVAETYIERWS